MNSGKILAAEIGNVPILKFVGDVRVLMSSTLDNYFSSLYKKAILDGMLVDLTETKGIDSTALGMLAKMSIQLRNRFNVRPTLISTNPDITKILKSMSVDIIADIVSEPLNESAKFGELDQVQEPQEEIRKKVIEAHKTLMTLSEENRIEFQDLVNALNNNR
ncbi:STAS domain-containing protein [Gammaproteobacteria bacterium]|nr:STAS domain-containing protein [Gammaproteobacteria bacterium]